MEFRISEYLSLRLEEGKTTIYVANDRITHCKYIFLINPEENINDIRSIDEAAERFNHVLEGEPIMPEDLGITPQQEFWAHCSNIQAWVENNYDTRILHSNLSFPLLQKLAEAGDSYAKIRQKEELIKRLEEGGRSTIIYLIESGWLFKLNENEFIENISKETVEKILHIFNNSKEKEAFANFFYDLINVAEDYHLLLQKKMANYIKQNNQEVIDFLYEYDLIYDLYDHEEFYNTFLVPHEKKIIMELEAKLKKPLSASINPRNRNQFEVFIHDNHIKGLYLLLRNLKKIPEEIFSLEYLEVLHLRHIPISDSSKENLRKKIRSREIFPNLQKIYF